MTTRVTPRWARALARLYALAAAALFPTSLIAGVWLYLSLASPNPAASPSTSPAVAVIVNVLLFGLFALHHSRLARTHAKAWLTRHVAPSLERSTYVLIASLLFLLVVAAWQPVPGLWYRVDGWPAWLLRAVQGIGIGLTLLAARAIDPFELAGLRQAMTFGRVQPDPAAHAATGVKDAKAAKAANGAIAATRRDSDTDVSDVATDVSEDIFTSTGLYGFVRHPIYFAWLLMVWPTPMMTSGRLTFAAVSSAYLLLAIPWEERSLLDQYGARYQRYRDQVRWRILPGIY
jgi:protein-S-isoprenylcysteine O-methyltransferase Ste14